MRKYFSLTRTLFKNAAGMVADGKTKKMRVYLLYGFLAICFIPLLFMLYYMFQEAFKTMAPLQQSGSILAAGFHMTNLVTFLFSIFLIPGVFYFSKDSEILLSLPLKPQTILASKFSVCLLYEYVFTLIVFLPLIAGYLQNESVSILFYVFVVIIALTLPIYPLVLSSIISMLVMRFVPFFKNRDRFNMIGGILSVAFALSFSYFMNSSGMQQEDPSALVNLLIEGNNSLISMFAYLFPAVPFASHALISQDILQLGLYLLILIAALAVFLIMGKYFYFKGAIGFDETKSTRKVLNDVEMKKALTQKSKVFTYTQKELRLLLRTPVYFLNCIGTCFIFPIVIVISIMSQGESLNLAALNQIDFSGYAYYAILPGLAMGMLIGCINMISATAISREGSNVMFMKYIPMPLGKQIIAKMNAGIIVSVLTILLLFIIAYILFPMLPILYYINAFISAIIAIFLGNELCILLDMAHPKLVWEQEAAAVKQNMSGMIAMFGGMLIAGLLIAALFLLPNDLIMPISIGICIAILLISVVIYSKMDTIACKLFKKI